MGRLRYLLLFYVLVLASCLAGADEEPPFAEFRRRAAMVESRSPADYALGRELIAEMHRMAASRKPFFDRSHLFFETVLWRAGRLWFSEKYWRDRSLITNRKFFKQGETWAGNTAISYRLMQEYDADGCNFFAIKSAQHVNLDAADQCGLAPDDFKIVPTVCLSPNPYWQMTDDVLRRINTQKHIWRIDGKPVYLTYGSGRYKADDYQRYFEDIRRRSGGDLVYIAEVTGEAIQLYPDTQYAVHKSVPATDLLNYFDFLTSLLKNSNGVEYGVYLGKQDLTLPYDYFNEYLLPLFGAACGQKEFNGKKILVLKVVGNYTNCNGSQTVYSNGTKTLRGYLELCRKHRVDIIHGFEWDEHNENTNLEPTVAKPMAYKRIFRYFMGQLKGKEPAPLEGDDLSLPNLIVSTRRQLGAGEELELELLHVPDGCAGSYQATVELFDQYGKSVYHSEALTFQGGEFKDHTLVIPTEQYPKSLFLQPTVKVSYKGQERTIAGFPPVVVRGTVAEDHTWFSTPLRNLLTAEGTVRFTPGTEIYPGVREMRVEADLRFNEPLVCAEVVQNSQDIYVHDPQDECHTAEKKNRLFKFYTRFSGPGSGSWNITLDAPAAQRLVTDHVNEKATLAPFDHELKLKMNQNTMKNDYFIVPEAALANGKLTISGKRVDGEADDSFSWEARYLDVLKTGLTSQVLSDGLQFALEVEPRPQRMALELNAKNVNFSDQLLVNNPDAVVALRVVSQNGKIYWSAAYAAEAWGKMIPVSVISGRRGVLDFTLPASRVPYIVYDFNQPGFGNVVPTSAGREFYAHAGGYLSIATGFEGVISAFSMPSTYVAKAAPPAWKDLPGGGRALVFDGKTTQALFFPKTAVPQRHGFTLAMELKPDDVTRDQILFEQRGKQSYLNGFMLSIKDGKLNLEYNCREPHKDHAPLSTWLKFPSDLTLENGVRQRVVLRFDGRKATLEANGRKASFPAEAMGLWLTSSAFGGRGSERFAGELYGVEIIHSPNYPL